MEIYKIAPNSPKSIAALLADISAGEPLSVASALERIDLNSLIAGSDPDAVVLVRVNGESMATEILSGDWVLIDRARTPRPNDIILAQVGDGFTLKRHKTNWKGKAGLWLIPSNDLYDVLEVTKDFDVVGVVTWVLRAL